MIKYALSRCPYIEGYYLREHTMYMSFLVVRTKKNVCCKWVSVELGFTVTLGVLHLELLACQVSMVSAAN